MCRKSREQLNDFAGVPTFFAPDALKHGSKPAAHSMAFSSPAAEIKQPAGATANSIRASSFCLAGLARQLQNEIHVDSNSSRIFRRTSDFKIQPGLCSRQAVSRLT
jgi:hypothetical protein